MYIEFVLTEEAPQIDPVAKTVVVGAASDGFITPSQIPAVFRIGGLIQVSFEPGEHGLFETTLVGEALDTGEARALKNWIELVPPPNPGWRLPRIYNYGFEIPDFFVDHEVEFALAVYINREFIGERWLSVVQAP
jgi:hypothetical protein